MTRVLKKQWTQSHSKDPLFQMKFTNRYIISISCYTVDLQGNEQLSQFADNFFSKGHERIPFWFSKRKMWSAMTSFVSDYGWDFVRHEKVLVSHWPDDWMLFAVLVYHFGKLTEPAVTWPGCCKVANYSRSSHKRTPSGREKSVRNWSWPLTRMVLVSGH